MQHPPWSIVRRVPDARPRRAAPSIDFFNSIICFPTGLDAPQPEAAGPTIFYTINPVGLPQCTETLF